MDDLGVPLFLETPIWKYSTANRFMISFLYRSTSTTLKQTKSYLQNFFLNSKPENKKTISTLYNQQTSHEIHLFRRPFGKYFVQTFFPNDSHDSTLHPPRLNQP